MLAAPAGPTVFVEARATNTEHEKYGETEMQTITKALERLMTLDWSELQKLMLACSEGHARMCAAAGEDVDPHTTLETMQTRIADMSKEDLARALAGFAALADVVHEHHPEHGH